MSVKKLSILIGSLTLSAIMLSCGSDGGNSPGGTDSANPVVPVDPVINGNWYKPKVSATWQWQLQGAVDTSYDVEIYDIDLFDVSQTLIDNLHQDGRKVLCYFSAGSYEDYRTDSSNFTPSDMGNTLDGFADERWLDIRSTNVWKIMQARLDLAVSKGCDGVEADNVDGIDNNTGLSFNANDQINYIRMLANAAHDRNLAFALKNNLDQIKELVDFSDLTVNEQCHEYNECELLQPFVDAGKPVLNAEYLSRYTQEPGLSTICQNAKRENFRTLILPLELDNSFRISCADLPNL